MEQAKKAIRIKEYPPLIPIKLIMEDRLVGAKSYKTVLKRLKSKGIEILAFDMVNTHELFSAMTKVKKKSIPIGSRRTEPFKLR
ncbi:hypothetical protein GCM10011344_40920 [Dokdonia pacifica]|uniref:Uncharacterized protein n=1 Tax=Dokdonia pacifica TaxID=1627892 RepID=A0A239AAX9_9FLAO|nr:hypothetical protein [Dokdonia pacifica]GGG35835.1 hypothetical protein GCM10011344_40920 [Dokdonia pacifica]SNR92552.1 hypothetical protein SAMN06265376_104278 [Dokdonia pacifica]